MSCRTLLIAAVLGWPVWLPGLAPAWLAASPSGAAARAAEISSDGARPLPLRRSSSAAAKDSQGSSRTGQGSRSAGDGWWTTLGGLVAVLGLVFLVAKVVRKGVPAAQKPLPPEVVHLLGRKALDYRHSVHLVRFGSRLLMLGTSQEGLRTLSEISDPVEIDYLAGLCKPSEPSSVAGTFSQLFQKFQNTDPTRPENERTDAPQAEAERISPGEIEPESDPAILRLQRRLQGAHDGGPLATKEAAG
jgi:flagellar biogenesis protein FliO